MSDVAKSKPGRKKIYDPGFSENTDQYGRVYDYNGKVDVEATIEQRKERGSEKIKYTAPVEDQKWHAKNVISIHWKLTGIKCPFPSFIPIMTCLIDHANPSKGRCDP